MVHTRWGIGQLRGAEVRRGCIFSESLSSTDGVIRNGGVIGSGAKFVSPTEGFRFSGAAGARISYGDVLRNPMSAITMMAWFRCDNTVATRMEILAQATAGAYGINITAGVLQGRFSLGGSVRNATATGTWNDNNWHLVVVTFSYGGYVKIYVDGLFNAQSAATYSFNLSPSATDDELTVGSLYNGAAETYNFKGNIKNCMVFNTALDADEIKEYYTNTAFQYKPVLSLPMRIDDHDITNVRTLDRSGLINHAVLGDGSTSTTYPTKLTTGNGYSFDGTTDYMESQNSVGFSSCTFAALVRFDAISLRAILSHGTGGDLFLLGCGVEGGVGTNTELYFSMFSGSWKRAGTAFTPATGKIYSVVGTFDGTTLKLYVDGVLRGTNTAAVDTREFPIRVGRRWDAANPNYFDGDIFEAFVSQRCFTATQVIDWDIRARECMRGC